jgi:flagellar motility protein MotE (MotC chaperone)
MVEELNKQKSDTQVDSAELQAEIDRLRVFEENQLAFEERLVEFDKNVVFNEKAPAINEYKSYYEDINPANAEILYRQVVEQIQFSATIKEKAEIYKNMDPKAAARILETMSADIEAVSQILLSMKAKESAGIMAEMDSLFAAKVTNKMLDLGEEKLSN